MTTILKNPDTIRIADYSQLRLIAWNRDPAAYIDAAEAFAFYEANWRFVEMDSMAPEERTLLERLINDYGAGVLNV